MYRKNFNHKALDTFYLDNNNALTEFSHVLLHD
jgi:hypothetical protein